MARSSGPPKRPPPLKERSRPLTQAVPDLDDALAKGLAFFRDRKTWAGVVARRLLSHPDADDESLTHQLINERRRRTRMDGGISGWVVATSVSAWELLQLGCPHDHTGVVRMIGYLLSRQDQPGRFGEGCTPTRHAIGHCQHNLSGFFSPGSTDTPVAPLTFPSGVTVDDEWDARFAASCFTLRTIIQAHQDRRAGVIRHIEGLLDLHERWQRGEFEPPLVLIFFALNALAVAPITYRNRVQALADYVIGLQEPDGSWPTVSVIQALETMQSLALPSARAAIQRAAPLLITQQQPDGSFDPSGNEHVALIALQALKSLGTSGATPRPPRFNTPMPRPGRPRRKPAGR